MSLARNGATIARKFKAKWMGPVIGVILAVAGGLLLLKSSLGHKLVFLSYDLPFYVRPYIFPTEVEMAYVDEASYTAAGPAFKHLYGSFRLCASH